MKNVTWELAHTYNPKMELGLITTKFEIEYASTWPGSGYRPTQGLF
jgi:hypothetical protein